MTREEKSEVIDKLTSKLDAASTMYVTDISGLNAAQTSNLRRSCNNANITLEVVKNTFLKKAMENAGKDFGELTTTLKGSTSIMIAEVGNAPGKLIKDFRRKSEKPVLKGAYVEESIYLGDDQLEVLANIKSKEELIGEVITLLQSPAKNVISALKSGGNKLSGILKTLSEK